MHGARREILARRHCHGWLVHLFCRSWSVSAVAVARAIHNVLAADRAQLTAEAHYTIMKRAGQYICAATKNGGIHILDSNSLSNIKAFDGHTGSISDMDAKGDFLATCGWSPRQQNAYMLDPFTHVFSLKTLKPIVRNNRIR